MPKEKERLKRENIKHKNRKINRFQEKIINIEDKQRRSNIIIIGIITEEIQNKAKVWKK